MEEGEVGGVRVRAQEDADGEFLLNLYAAGRWAELAEAVADPEERWRLVELQFEAREAQYRAVYGAGGEWFVLEDGGGDRVGRLVLGQRDGVVVVVDIALVDAWQGKGVGTALLERVTGEAAGRGEAVVLSVGEANRARGLYTRLGFREAESDGVTVAMVWEAPGGDGG